MKRVLAVIAVSVALVLGSGAARAQLLGDNVNLKYYFPDLSTLFEDDGNQVVTAGGVTFTSFGTVLTTVTPGQINLTSNVISDFTTSSFNGIVLTDLTNSPITSVTVDAATNTPGFDASRISFTANSVSINMQSLPTTPDLHVVVDINGAAVPEPGALALLAGLVIPGVVMFRRRK